MIRKASENDIAAVAAIYEHIHDNEEAGRVCIGWVRGVYPTAETARAALGRGELYVYDDGAAVRAAAIINKTQVDCYADCEWGIAADPDKVIVLHTLVVEPAFSGRGVATEFVAFYEALGSEWGCTVARMDTNAKNTAARALYAKLGYREAGAVPCVFNGIPGVSIVCLEKQLAARCGGGAR